MPLPKKKKGESEEEFMSRCMRDDNAQKEFPDHKQQVAVCLSKSGKKKKKTEEDVERLNRLDRAFSKLEQIEDLLDMNS